MDFSGFLTTYQEHLENPEWLSQAIVKLSALLYTHNSQMAQAELEESRVAINYLSLSTPDKKVSVSEAEKRAVVDTNNHYMEMKVTGDAIVETINSIKKRIDVLSYERRMG